MERSEPDRWMIRDHASKGDGALDTTEDRQTTGLVFNVQRYSVHDGPGIRTVVFLKGCPLRCRWCCNPESWSPQIELAYNPGKCLTLSECMRCVEVCTAGAISRGNDDTIRVDRQLCQECMNCAAVCPARALSIYGQRRTAKDVVDVVEQDSVFYTRSGGGMTLSGGEPLFQPDFALALLREARRRHIHTAVETCGCAPYETLHAACGLTRTLIFDIKSTDPRKHKAFTGRDNGRIIENFRNICRAFPNLPVCVRTPIIPGFNDTEADIRPILETIRGFPRVTYELLPYHRFGIQKYAYLGRPYPMDGTVLDDAIIDRLKALAGAHGNSAA